MTRKSIFKLLFLILLIIPVMLVFLRIFFGYGLLPDSCTPSRAQQIAAQYHNFVGMDIYDASEKLGISEPNLVKHEKKDIYYKDILFESEFSDYPFATNTIYSAGWTYRNLIGYQIGDFVFYANDNIVTGFEVIVRLDD